VLGEGRADLFIESATVIAETLDRLQLPDLRVARPVDLGAGELHLASGRAGAAQLAPLAAALEALGTSERQARIARWTAVTNVSPSLPLQLSAGERRQLADLPALRVAVVDGQAPFAWVGDEGQPVGLSVDMLVAALSRLDLPPPTLRPMTADAALEALREGRADLALGLPELATRRHGIGFAGPYIAHPLMLAAPRRSGLWSLEQMGGRRLAMPALQVPETLLRTRYPRVQPVICETIVACLGQVERGEADAMVADVVSLALVLGGGGFGELQLVGTAGDLRHERGIAVSPGRRAQLAALQRALDVAVAEDLPALKSRWLERPPPQRLLRELIRRALPWGVGALLLIGGLWWWHAAGLRAEVARTRSAQAQAERAAAVSRRFLVFLAHEVRNSLHSVIAASELLRGQPGIAPSVTEPLGRSARATLALLNGLLDRERLAAGALTLDPGPVRLPALVASVVEEMAPLAEAAGVSLRPEPMPDRLLRVDALRVQQVLRNLLSNAIKYGGPGVVEIAHEVALSDRACRVTLTVRDHGPGLDGARLQSAFEPFAAATRGRADSAGLGLALGRDLARALGGDLTLETPAGGGLRARFVWLAACLETPPSAATTSSRVLVVEDAEVYAMLLRRAFEAAGWQVATAAGVAEARACLAAASFDLLLTDLHLPDGDAQDVLAAARQPGLRRIVMTADVDAAPAGLGDADVLVAKAADARLFVARILETVRPATA
jgi:signal transduction histidine kinase